MELILNIVSVFLLGVGLSLVWLGQHYLGPLWFWAGGLTATAGALLLGRHVGARAVEKALRRYDGPADFGDTNYHSGYNAAEDSHHPHDGGGEDFHG